TNGMLYWPIVAGFAALTLRAVPAELEEAARLEAPPWRALAVAARPGLGVALGAGGLLVFLLALADFGVPSTFDLAVYPVELFAQFSGDYDGAAAVVSLATGAAAAVVAAGLALPLALLAERRLGQLTPPAAAGLAALATAGYALPGALIAVALIGLLNRPGPLGALYDSAGVLV